MTGIPDHLLAMAGPQTLAVQGGQTPVLRGERGILRLGPAPWLAKERDAAAALLAQLPALDPWLPRTLDWRECDGWAALLQTDLGDVTADPWHTMTSMSEVLAATATAGEAVPLQGTLRALLPQVLPPGRCTAANLVRDLRAARKAGQELPFAPNAATLERALDQPLALHLQRGWAHGALTPARVLQLGCCHWRHAGPHHIQGVDIAPFVEPEPDDPGLCLLVLKWAWRHDPVRAARALLALGLLDPAPPQWVELRVTDRHPAVHDAALARILGCAPGRVTRGDAARALGRAQGLVLGGIPLSLSSTPPVTPVKDRGLYLIRDRDPRRLFSRWHDGIQMDPDARASLTPEDSALDMAHKLGARRPVDGFCGAGGNAIALARMPWCQQVLAIDLDPTRINQARHNARVYGVQDRIRFLVGDFFALAPTLEGHDAVVLDPPWALGAAPRVLAWQVARRHFPRGVLKQPRQAPPPADANQVEICFGVGPIVSFLLAWWGAGPGDPRR